MAADSLVYLFVGGFLLFGILGYVYQLKQRLLGNRLQRERLEHELAQSLESRTQLERTLEEFRLKEHRYVEQLAMLKTALSKEREAMEEKEQFFSESRERLKLEFSDLAQKLLKERGEQLNAQQNERLALILKPFSEEMKNFRGKVESAHIKEVESHATLLNEIKNLKALNLKISEEAIHLTQALKGDNKMQGNWGEMILERALEDSGLVKGREYEIQTSLRSGDGRLFRPDVIVHLPEGRDIIIDSKVSLTAYERFMGSNEESERLEHVRSIKNHIKELSQKSYDSLLHERTLDFVLMFIPIEAAFVEVARSDSALFQNAYEQNIILVSPSTLLATLRTVNYVWRYERQSQNAEEIARQAGDMYDKFVSFSDDLLKVGEQLERTQKVYGEVFLKLKEGRGNLISRAERLRELGIKSKKSLDQRYEGFKELENP
ncbi:MAG: DNA recombination protein RmuC [Wolinella sp.]